MRLLMVYVLLYLAQIASGQLVDDFSDGDLTSDPMWLGDVTEFAIVDGMCRLNASDAGQSYIYTPTTFPDSVQLDFTFEINTNPSGGNNSRVYFLLDDPDLSMASGYYLQLGSAGSDDAITLVQLDNGIASDLAAGTMGAIATRPELDIRITIRNGGMLELSASAPGANSYSSEIVTMIDWPTIDTGFFGLEATYTASNVTRYAFDNISLQTFTPDREPPFITDVFVTGDDSFSIVFDESLDGGSIANSSVTVDNSLSVIDLIIGPSDDRTLAVTTGSTILSGPTYTVSVVGITDLAGNATNSASQSFVRAVSPVAGDLVINELLFNPEGAGSDYVELLNISEKILHVDGLIISNSDNGNSSSLNSDRQLLPGDYLVITEDPSETESSYPTNDVTTFEEADLPPLNNSDGNVNITTLSGELIDNLDYDEGWHFGLLDDVDGVSLERIDPTGNSQSADNWQSAASSVGYGTPGVLNSSFVTIPIGDDFLDLLTETFSPNLDGDSDQMIISYNLPSNGYIANLRVFDQRGHLIRQLYNNELLGTTGVLVWDGTDAMGRRASVGPYILQASLFDLQGNRIDWQKPVILADFLD